jgi:lipopolysaccharide export system permease protein
MNFIIRKLILKEWSRFFLGSAFVLFLLVTVANLISGFLRSSVNTREVILGYVFEVPTFLNMILPISCLIASLFSINKLKSRNELTAIFASGFSRKDYIATIALGSILVSLMQFSISAYLDPHLKEHRTVFFEQGNERLRSFRSQGLKASTVGSGRVWYKTAEYFFSFVAFDRINYYLNGVNLYFFNNDQYLTKIIQAESAHHLYDNVWRFQNVLLTDHLASKDFPQLENHETLVLQINETPEDFFELEADVTTLKPGALLQYIKRLNHAGINSNEYFVIFLNKFSSAIICLIFAILASVGLFNPNRRNSALGKNLLFVFVFTLVYWLVYSYTFELGSSSKINPYLATFTVPIFFSISLVIFFLRNRKLR